MRIAILSNHLSGSGHFLRSLALARAAMAAGHDVRLISGGRRLDHIPAADIAPILLPPLAVLDHDYSTLRAEDGSPAGDALMAERLERLRATLAPGVDVLVTETYPFGRRMLRREYEAAIAACPGAALIASVRDIPEPKPHRLAETAARLDGYDGVLVHGDAGFLPLSASWPLPERLGAKIRHMGYLARALPAAAPGSDVLVATGGGALGGRLIACAAEAAWRSPRPWHILIGGADAAGRAAALSLPPGSLAGPARSDYPALLAGAACSVSLTGYNTAAEIAQATTPAVLVPAEMGGDREQAIRAQALAGFPGLRVLPEQYLTAEALATAVEALASGPRRAPLPIRLDPEGRNAVAALEHFARARARA